MFDHVVAAVVICYCLCSFEYIYYRVVRINVYVRARIYYMAYHRHSKHVVKWVKSGVAQVVSRLLPLRVFVCECVYCVWCGMYLHELNIII